MKILFKVQNLNTGHAKMVLNMYFCTSSDGLNIMYRLVVLVVYMCMGHKFYWLVVLRFNDQSTLVVRFVSKVKKQKKKKKKTLPLPAARIAGLAQL